MTNGAFFEIYRKYQEENMAFGTSYSRTNLIKNHFLEEYGEKELSDITYITINCVYDSMADSGFSDNTIFGIYAALMSFFKMAAEYGEVESNPVCFAKSVRPEMRNRRKS